MTTAAPYLRRAVAPDLSLLADIERAAATLFPPGRIPDPDDVHDADEFAAYLAGGLLWVAEVETGVVAFLAARPLDGELHVDELDVHPRQGRRGIGARLLAQAKDEAYRRGLARVTLTTFDDLPWNGPYYRRLGFRTLVAAEQSEALKACLAEERAAGLCRRIAMACPAGPLP